MHAVGGSLVHALLLEVLQRFCRGSACPNPKGSVEVSWVRFYLLRFCGGCQTQTLIPKSPGAFACTRHRCAQVIFPSREVCASDPPKVCASDLGHGP